MNRKTVSVLAAGLLVFAIGACDFSPSSPFEGFEESQRQGATLNGRFQQGGSAASSQPVALRYNVAQRTLASTHDGDGLTVTEVYVYAEDGSEIGSVDVNSDGSFTLRGLPESFTLVYMDENGDPVGDPMDFDGVRPNQEIDIVVTMAGDNVVLVEESRTGIDHEGSSGVELQGTAENIVIDTPPMTGSLDVNGQHVLTRAGETSIRKGNRSLTLEDLENGDQVHVRGVYEGDDVFAFEIKLQEEEEEEGEEEQVTLCHIPPGNPDNAKTITVGASAVPAHLAHGDYLGACNGS